MRIRLFIKALTVCIVAAGLMSPRAGFAQGPGNQPDMTIDAATRSAVIEGALKNLNDYYVFPETAKKMEQAIKDRAQKKEYDQITSAKALAETLTAHLQDVSHDKHLRVRYSYEKLPDRSDDGEPTAQEREQ